MKYKVVIPSAGLGARLKNLSTHVNKSLVSVGCKPVISHVIEKFPEDVEIVVPVGYKKDTVESYLRFAHPERKITIVEINNFEGKGSGLGFTLLQCEQELQCPFIFSANDTIVLEDIPSPTDNWMGYAERKNLDQYRSIQIDESGQVSDILSKGAGHESVMAYIGLGGVKDYKDFWNFMREGADQGSIEIGESFAFKMLLKQGVKSKKFTWFDTGNIESLEIAREEFRNPDYNILDKPNESIWFTGGRVIKFSTDEEFIRNRVERAKSLAGFTPSIIDHSKNMYVYDKVDGEVLSKNPNVSNFESFLGWMGKFWKRYDLNEEEYKKFCRDNLEFYKTKTFSRIKQYFETFEQVDSEEIINGVETPKIFSILEYINWDALAKGEPTRFHGDLHFENILISNNPKKPFTLLDWRQDFAGNLLVGDKYYDLAKLNHGLIICHELINKDLFTVQCKFKTVTFDFHRKSSLVDCENYFREFALEHGLNYKKVEVLTALIYLNIAALHHYPYSSLLFYLGKSMLYKLVQDNKKDGNSELLRDC
jgi:choline kinase